VNPLSRVSSRAISVEPTTVVKIQKPGASRRERLRTEAGRAVAQRTGLFTVPEIVSFDDSRGAIVFERLHLTGIRQVLSDPTRCMGLAERVARILAAIHGLMKPDQGATRTAPGEVGISPQRAAVVPLHGDFGVSNVLFLPASDRLVVIDWSNADWIGVKADLGAPEIDVAVFLRSLFHRSLLDRTPGSRRHSVARQFLATYASASPCGLDLASLRGFVATTGPAFIQLTRQRKGVLRALGYRHAMVDLNFFLRRISREGLSV
jgi:tRNA A-37 threonylcarbamoyl transferase component Bud32